MEFGCESSREWRPASDFLNIKRHIAVEDLFAKRGLVYSLIILAIYAIYLLIGWKAGWDMFTWKDFTAMVIFFTVAFIIFLFFFQLDGQREEFLSGIKIHGNGEGVHLSNLICELADFGATIVDSGGEADYEIDKLGDEYRVFEDLGARLIFSIRIDYYDHNTEIAAMAIATAIYTLRRQHD